MSSSVVHEHDGPVEEDQGGIDEAQEGTGAAGRENGQGAREGRRTRRTVLWSVTATGVVVAALIAVFSYSQPSSNVVGQSPLLGKPAPSISGPGLNGGHYSLGQFRGKWVLVNFMASWCPPCRAEFPELKIWEQQHARRKDAVLLTVADDPSDVSHLRTYLKVHGATWPAVDDPAATVSYGLAGLPSSFLVSPDGTVYAYILGQVTATSVNNWLQKGAAQGFGPA